MAFLSSLGGKLVLAGIVALAFLGLWAKDKFDVAQKEKAEAASLAWQGETSRLQQLANQNEATLKEINAQIATSTAAAKAARDNEATANARLDKLKQEIAHAPHGPVPGDIVLAFSRMWDGHIAAGSGNEARPAALRGRSGSLGAHPISAAAAKPPR